MKKLRISMLLILLTSVVFIQACFALPEEPPALAMPAFVPPPVMEFRIVQAARGDVRNVTRVAAQYTLVTEVSLSFEEAGHPIIGIFVQAGDYVQAGDLVASYGIIGLSEEQEELARTRDNVLLQIRQANERHQLALDIAAESGIPIDDSRYLADIDILMGELEIAQFQLSRVSGLYAGSHLIAPKSGLVTHAMRFTSGMNTTVGSRVVAISDPFNSAFIVRDVHVMPLMTLGEQFYITIEGRDILIEVVCPEERGYGGRPEWANAAFLTIVEDHIFIGPGTTGMLTIVHAEATDVVYIPNALLREVGDRTFVYVLEDGIRQIRDVVVGVRGNTTMEIVSGLEEGDDVIQ